MLTKKDYINNITEVKLDKREKMAYLSVVVMPRTILPQRNRRCALSATGTQKPEEEKNARGVTCFNEENEISLRDVVRFDEHNRD